LTTVLLGDPKIGLAKLEQFGTDHLIGRKIGQPNALLRAQLISINAMRQAPPP
jgi:hypothetical protein